MHLNGSCTVRTKSLFNSLMFWNEYEMICKHVINDDFVAGPTAGSTYHRIITGFNGIVVLTAVMNGVRSTAVREVSLLVFQ
jgi:hypothetical protein